MLGLLAVIAKSLAGADYTPASERLAEWLEDGQGSGGGGPVRGPGRRAQIAAVAAAVGGDV